VHASVNDITTVPVGAWEPTASRRPEPRHGTERLDAERLDGERPAAGPGVLPAAAFDQFYATQYDQVARALGLTLGDADLGAEAADEAMVRAFQRWHHVRTYANPGGWAYRVGLNWARSVLRRRRRGERLPLYAAPAAGAPVVGEPAVAAALAELGVDQRAVVVCRYLLDWSVEETAAALGVRPGTVQSRLHRAVQQLQSRLSHLR
jgi:RNA polymerase sigma-70 factor (ECF subfamily)